MDSKIIMTKQQQLLSEPILPEGWEQYILQKRRDRYLDRRYKHSVGIDWVRPEDPLGYWAIFVKVVKSSRDSKEFDKKTRRPRKIYEYAYLPVMTDLEESVQSLQHRIRESTHPLMRHEFHLEMNGTKMHPESTMSQYYIENGTVLSAV